MDKIDVTVNAPFSGKILELLAEEESTVTVGEDLFVLEAGEGEAGSSLLFFSFLCFQIPAQLGNLFIVVDDRVI